MRHVLLAGASEVSRFGAAWPRLQSIEAAFTEAGWTVDLGYGEQAVVAQSEGRSNAQYRSLIPLGAVRALSRLGISDEVQMRQIPKLWRQLKEKNYDLVVTTPPPFSLIATAVLTDKPVIIDYRDTFSATGRPHLVARSLSLLERWCARHAAAITYAGGKRFGEYITQVLDIDPLRVHRVPNGVIAADVPEPPTEADRSTNKPLDVVWIGSLYGFADLSPVLHALQIVGPSRAHIEIISPTPRATVERYIPRDIPGITFSPPLPHDQLYARLQRADAGLIVLSHDYPHELSVPAKYYDYLAACLPVLYVGPEDAALLDEPGATCVYHHASDDIAGICQFLRSAVDWRRPGTDLLPHIDRSVSMSRLVEIGEKLVCASA